MDEQRASSAKLSVRAERHAHGAHNLNENKGNSWLLGVCPFTGTWLCYAGVSVDLRIYKYDEPAPAILQTFSYRSSNSRSGPVTHTPGHQLQPFLP